MSDDDPPPPPEWLREHVGGHRWLREYFTGVWNAAVDELVQREVASQPDVDAEKLKQAIYDDHEKHPEKGLRLICQFLGRGGA